MKKIYYIYRLKKNPDVKETFRKLKELFGEGYIFEEKYSHLDKKKLTREKIRILYRKDMEEGNFDLVIVDNSYGKGRFMKEEIKLAKDLGIPIKEINLNEEFNSPKLL